MLPDHSSKNYGDLWVIQGIDSKSRVLRWNALHFCIYGWAVAAVTGNRSTRRALGLMKTIKTEKSSSSRYNRILSTLIQHRAFVDGLDYKCRTPLMLAAAASLPDAIKILLEAGSSVDSTDLDGNTPLHFAYAFGNSQICVILEAQGANIEARNIGKCTPLDMAGKLHSLLPVFIPTTL